jgi:hypothetical protein
MNTITTLLAFYPLGMLVVSGLTGYFLPYKGSGILDTSRVEINMKINTRRMRLIFLWPVMLPWEVIKKLRNVV